jgi:hypothetical protein
MAGMERRPSACPISRVKSHILICITVSPWKVYFLGEIRRKAGMAVGQQKKRKLYAGLRTARPP